MNDRQKNMFLAINAAGITMVGVVVLFYFFITPIQGFEREKFLDECDPKGFTCTVEPNPLFVVLGVIPFMVFVIMYKHLETRRNQTWSSYK